MPSLFATYVRGYQPPTLADDLGNYLPLTAPAPFVWLRLSEAETRRAMDAGRAEIAAKIKPSLGTADDIYVSRAVESAGEAHALHAAMRDTRPAQEADKARGPHPYPLCRDADELRELLPAEVRLQLARRYADWCASLDHKPFAVSDADLHTVLVSLWQRPARVDDVQAHNAREVLRALVARLQVEGEHVELSLGPARDADEG